MSFQNVLCKAILPLYLLLIIIGAVQAVSKAFGGDDRKDGDQKYVDTSRDQNAYFTKPYFSNIAYGEGHPLCAFLDNQGYTIDQFGGKGCGLQQNR